jgi:hypothetical protein
MKWMNFAGADKRSAKFYAGLYLHTPHQVRFWGLGEPATRATEKPWAPLAEWLRAAHSLIDSAGEASPAAPAEVNPTAAAREESAPGTHKRRLRFVCNRRFVGFVIR